VVDGIRKTNVVNRHVLSEQTEHGRPDEINWEADSRNRMMHMELVIFTVEEVTG